MTFGHKLPDFCFIIDSRQRAYFKLKRVIFYGPYSLYFLDSKGKKVLNLRFFEHHEQFMLISESFMKQKKTGYKTGTYKTG